MLQRYFSGLFLNTWQEAEAGSKASMSADKGFKADMQIIIILVYTAVGISITKYFGHTTDFLDHVVKNPNSFDLWFCSFFFGSETGRFHSMLFWVFMILVFYLFIPFLLVKFVFKGRAAEFGWRIKGIQKDYPLYILMLVVMLPLVYFASSSQAFQDRYPLFQPSKGNLFPVFLWWQMAYFMQFVAIEFFFRGFLLHGIRHRFGFYSIFIMTIPYCLVHIGKPFTETIAAIAAGIVLGTLSLKSRSVFMGVLIHFSVAISMDVFALWREGYFFN